MVRNFVGFSTILQIPWEFEKCIEIFQWTLKMSCWFIMLNKKMNNVLSFKNWFYKDTLFAKDKLKCLVCFIYKKWVCFDSCLFFNWTLFFHKNDGCVVWHNTGLLCKNLALVYLSGYNTVISFTVLLKGSYWWFIKEN